ncbi:hypothetical protein AUEXF2481DRAFT_42231 [Aureobasidium subglaciale EXF-2481]|uniref:Uncharacterized protein n=1 Tax=Aureobasidium subglaciale (strain EXF-2481) TaxID=1043005 RepID=A0A074YG27_AURSE|nr:uncharacterized protein AUEXF2481DRAFT_42231 [Aureobasidium subglaciale EXF-2481]KEQ93032.1 hypothetical protein AUEXF2481DRAFT_42231 [Aureobasidium subglaciale EXF-2481]
MSIQSQWRRLRCRTASNHVSFRILSSRSVEDESKLARSSRLVEVSHLDSSKSAKPPQPKTFPMKARLMQSGIMLEVARRSTICRLYGNKNQEHRVGRRSIIANIKNFGEAYHRGTGSPPMTTAFLSVGNFGNSRRVGRHRQGPRGQVKCDKS